MSQQRFIAHEINQPLAAIVANGDAGLRWLSGDMPNLEETSKAIRRIIRDGKRANAVVSRMRVLFKKAPTEKELLDLNDVIQEVVAITQSEAQRNRISLRTDFADDLPRVMADRVQVQQVILNLLAPFPIARNKVYRKPVQKVFEIIKLCARCAVPFGGRINKQRN